jgi:hypothetical protein
MKNELFKIVLLNDSAAPSMIDAKEASSPCKEDTCSWVDYCTPSDCTDGCTVDFTG